MKDHQMSVRFIELNDRFITDKGEIVITYDTALTLVRDGYDISLFMVEPDERFNLYEKLSSTKLNTFIDDGEPIGPNPETLEWDIPEKYIDLDIKQFCIRQLDIRGLNSNDYTSRVDVELDMMNDRNMLPMLRYLVALIDDFRSRQVVWGVGRGSCCASIILYLMDVHRVDCVKYDIDIEEFLR